MVQMLTLVNQNGRSVLDLASDDKISKLLKSKGAKTSADLLKE